jgi:hypothetical protein
MMRRVVVFMGMIVFLFTSVLPLNAGGIFNKQNLSTDYLRSLTRNASTDAADIVVYISSAAAGQFGIYAYRYSRHGK